MHYEGDIIGRSRLDGSLAIDDFSPPPPPSNFFVLPLSALIETSLMFVIVFTSNRRRELFHLVAPNRFGLVNKELLTPISSRVAIVFVRFLGIAVFFCSSIVLE